MEAIFLYLLKASLISLVLYLSYHFILRGHKQFVFNRIFLLLVLPVAHIIPLIQIPIREDLSRALVYVNETTPITPEADIAIQATNNPETMNWLTILGTLYIIGIVFCLLRFALSYLQAYKIYKTARKNMVGNQTVYLSPENIRAFTFINKIIIGSNIIHHPDLEMVVDHEKVHLNEKHFIDLFLIEFLSAFQWFNPVVYVLNRAIRLNLEYRVDDMVTQNSNMRRYQMALVSMVSDRIALPQFTELNSNNLKNRILMMKSTSNSKFTRIRKLAILPIFLILLACLSEKTTAFRESDGNENTLMASETAKAKNNPSNNEISTIDDLSRYFSKSLRYPEEARKFGQVGSVILYFNVDNKGKLTGFYEEQPSGEVYYYPDGSLKGDPFKSSDIVIVGYESNPSAIPILINKSNQHSKLYEECKRVINALPIVNIDKLKGKTVKIAFEFKLKSI
ncbi:M56 family metallopeptidase [uncultured Cyclobacterium sp.]|uniref:M56 family metallopeptidase n=1 Tax=uncultured Cyclobacterium sp. TaxID=453820 RepID=UPI0030EFA0C1|tara:strand:+ start:85726 stop:87078 length:1353 start_codon:yes stop_codon:yes gene_type:complete